MTDPGQPPSAYGQPPAYGPPPYGPNAYGQPRPAGRSNGMGVTALVLGVLAILTSWLVLGLVLGILGVVFGILGRKRAHRGLADNGGQALAGLITGIIGVLAGIAFLTLYIAVFASDSGRDYLDCLGSSHSRAEQKQCQDEFSQHFGN
ncbi:MAG: hypothetical protein JWL64_2527 [Frankiales bacterium]|nr:hypothetical protein [Frankiales bacterium]